MKLINITAPQYRCEISASCPAVYISEDGKTFTIIGFTADPSAGDLAGKVSVHESAVEISADLLLSSLGIADLIEAAKQAEIQLANFEAMCRGTDRTQHAAELAETLRALRSVLTRIQGGDGNG